MLSLLRRILVSPLQLILPVRYLLPQRPHHELPPTEIPHLRRGEDSTYKEGAFHLQDTHIEMKSEKRETSRRPALLELPSVSQ